MEDSTIFTVLALTASLLVIYYKWIFGFWKRRNVQTLSPNLFLGNLSDVIFGKIPIVELFEKTYQELKSKGYKYAGYYFMVKPVLLVFDLNLINQICVKDFSHFTDRPLHINKEDDPLSGNLLALKGAEWKNLRNILTPTMSPNKLKMMLDILISKSNNIKTVLEEACKTSEIIEIKNLTTKLIVDIIGTCFFGIESDSLLNKENEFIKFIEVQTDGIIQNAKILIAFLYPTLLNKLGVRLSDKTSEDFYLNFTKKTVEYREQHNVVKKDLMQLLIQLRNNINIENDRMDLKGSELNEGKKLLSINEIAAVTFIFFGVGCEITSSTITFCLFELTQQPKLQDKLRNEINSVLAKNNGEISYDNLHEMSFLDMCIYETIRKYPMLPFITRVCTKDWIMPETNLSVKKGSQIYIPVLQIQKDPEYFLNPDQFDPDRFLPDNKSKMNRNAFLPFGDGPRMCIGRRVGLLKVKVVLTTLLKNFKFTLNPKTTVPLEKDKRAFVFAIKGGIWLNIEKI